MNDDPKQTKFKVRDLRGEPAEYEKEAEVEMSEPEEEKPTEQKAKEEESDESVGTPSATSAGAPQTSPDQPQEFKINFSTFAMSMTTSALMHMGLIEDHVTKKKETNLQLAQQDIDILSMLEEKTRGNLAEEEKKLIDEALYELRLRFVEASK